MCRIPWRMILNMTKCACVLSTSSFRAFFLLFFSVLSSLHFHFISPSARSAYVPLVLIDARNQKKGKKVESRLALERQHSSLPHVSMFTQSDYIICAIGECVHAEIESQMRTMRNESVRVCATELTTATVHSAAFHHFSHMTICCWLFFLSPSAHSPSIRRIRISFLVGRPLPKCTRSTVSHDANWENPRSPGPVQFSQYGKRVNFSRCSPFALNF